MEYYLWNSVRVTQQIIQIAGGARKTAMFRPIKYFRENATEL